MIQRWRPDAMHPPRLLAHCDDAPCGGRRRGEMDVAHHRQGVADGVVDRALAALAPLHVGDGDPHGQGGAGGPEHLGAIGDEQEQVGTIALEDLGEAERGPADRPRDVGLGVRFPEAFNAGGDGEAIGLDDVDGVSILGTKVGPGDEKPNGQVGTGGQLAQGPVEVAIVGAGGSDDGDGAGHEPNTLLTMSDSVPFGTTAESAPPFERSAAYYDAIYAVRGKDYEREASYVQAAAERALGRPARSWLDAACGTGSHLAYLGAPDRRAGFDKCEAMLAIASDKLPGTALLQAELTQFEMAERFDVVSCLFASIAYLGDEAAMTQAISRMAAHLEPWGVLLIEPGVFQEDLAPPCRDETTVQCGAAQVKRIATARVEDAALAIDFAFRIEEAGIVREFLETHIVQLLPKAGYEAVLETTGLEVRFDAQGPAGRGLFIARLKR